MGILSRGWCLPVAAIFLACVEAQWTNRFDVTHSQSGCPNGKGVCVQPQYCLEKRNTAKPSGLHNCITEGKLKGVCCARKKTTLDKDCTTSKRGPGLCVAADQCHSGYTRDFLVPDKDINKDSWWKQTSNVCYQEKRKNFYCCPTELQKPIATLPPKKPVQSWNDNAFSNCKLTKNGTGKCVPIRLCDEFHSRVMSLNPFYKYEQVGQRYKCASKNSDSTAVCCQHPKTPDGLIRHEKAKKFLPDKCGAFELRNRVLEGKEAGLGEFPWMANIMYYWKRNKTTICSGTLIHPRYVLTAAHCLKRNPISVRLGEHDLSKNRDCVEKVCAKPIREYAIANWTIHEKYNGTAGQYDIALVQLNQPAMIEKGHIYPICLPITEKWLMMKPTKLTVSGWGLTKEDVLPDVLMHATLATLETTEEPHCQSEQVICARGANGEGHCSGDSGGPLQQIMRYGRQFRMVLFGVTSGGAKKCNVEDRTAGVSMSVAYYMKWILDNMKI